MIYTLLFIGYMAGALWKLHKFYKDGGSHLVEAVLVSALWPLFVIADWFDERKK